MSEITREHALFNIKTVLRAFVNKIENAREYIDYLPLEGKEIVQAYESDKDDCRTLLLAAKENEDFFAGLSDEDIIAYANVCYELNELLGLRVKNLYKVTKIKDCGEYKLICTDGDFVSPPCSKDFSIVKINGEKVNFPTTLTKRVDWQLLDANEKVIDEMSFKDIIDMNPFTRTIRFPDKGTYTVRAKIYAAGLVSETLTDVLDYKQTINGGEIVNSDNKYGKNITLSADSWKVYLNEKNKITKVDFGTDKTKVQIIKSNGTISEIINIDTEEYKKLGGFAKKLLTAAGADVTNETDLELQEKMFDSGLFYASEEQAKRINMEKGWIRKQDYYDLMTPKDFLNLKNYEDVTVKAVYEDSKNELTFTYTVDSKTEKLFVIKASNRQRDRNFPTENGDIKSSPLRTMPNNELESSVFYKPGKFPKGNWFIKFFEESFSESYGPYKIRTNATRKVIGYEPKYDEKESIIDWKEIKNEKGENVLYEDGHLLIHGGTGREIAALSNIERLDARKGENDYTGTTHGCIRISNLDVCLIVETLKTYLASKGGIELEVK